MDIEFNINWDATVTLTAAGANQYNTAHEDFWQKYPEYAKPVEAGYVLREHLWLLMQMFGSNMYCGSVLMFEDCKMTLHPEGEG